MKKNGFRKRQRRQLRSFTALILVIALLLCAGCRPGQEGAPPAAEAQQAVEERNGEQAAVPAEAESGSGAVQTSVEAESGPETVTDAASEVEGSGKGTPGETPAGEQPPVRYESLVELLAAEDFSYSFTARSENGIYRGTFTVGQEGVTLSYLGGAALVELKEEWIRPEGLSGTFLFQSLGGERDSRKGPVKYFRFEVPRERFTRLLEATNPGARSPLQLGEVTVYRIEP